MGPLLQNMTWKVVRDNMKKIDHDVFDMSLRSLYLLNRNQMLEVSVDIVAVITTVLHIKWEESRETLNIVCKGKPVIHGLGILISKVEE